MFNDPTVRQMVFHHVVNFGIFIGLALIWWLYIVHTLKPFFKAVSEASADSKRSAPAFPFISLLVMVAISFGGVYYWTTEGAFRSSRGVTNPLQDVRDTEIQRRDAEHKTPEYTPQRESQEDKTQRLVEKNRQENEEAKKRFQELPPVRDNGQGGAVPAEPAKSAP